MPSATTRRSFCASADHHAEAARDKAVEEQQRQRERGEAQIIEGHALADIEAGEVQGAQDLQAVLAAIFLQGDEEVIEHLVEGERDHDEIGAAGAQAHQPGEKRDIKVRTRSPNLVVRARESYVATARASTHAGQD